VSQNAAFQDAGIHAVLVAVHETGDEVEVECVDVRQHARRARLDAEVAAAVANRG